MEIAPDVLAGMLSIAALLRIEHLFASDIWIARRSSAFVKDIDRGEKRRTSTSARLDALERHGGGKMPWLYFGIKSYKLDRWIRNELRQRATPMWLCALAIRLSFKYYLFAPGALVVALILGHFTSSEVGDQLLFSALTFLNVGSIFIAAEGVLMIMMHGSWASAHHTWFEAEDPARRDTNEVSIVIGSSILAFIVLAGTVLFTARSFGEFPDVAATSGIRSIWEAMQAVSPTSFLLDSEEHGTSADVTRFVGTLVQLSYLGFLLQVLVARVISNRE